MKITHSAKADPAARWVYTLSDAEHDALREMLMERTGMASVWRLPLADPRQAIIGALDDWTEINHAD